MDCPTGSGRTNESVMNPEMLAAFRRQAFDTYFAGVVSMAQHPGTTRDAAKPMTLEESAGKALEMLRIRDELIAEGVL